MAEHVRKPVQVTGPVHDGLTKIARQEAERLGRAVTFSEVIEGLLELYNELNVSERAS